MRRVVKRIRRVVFVASAVAMLVATPSASAATFSPMDVAGLVAAIDTANANGEDDTIDLGGQTFTLTAVASVVDGENGLPDILADDGHALTIRNGTIERSLAAPEFRLVHVSAGATLVLEGMALRNGEIYVNLAFGNGAAVFNLGTVSVARSTISGCFARDGGAISNNADLSISDSVFSANRAIQGGAIANNATLFIIGSTFSGNWAEFFGGAIISRASVSAIRNSTFSGNNAMRGGAIFNEWIIGSITNTTIALNHVYNELPGGGGIFNDGQILDFASNIVAANTEGVRPDISSYGVIGFTSHNVIGIGEGSGLTDGVNGNQVGSLAAPLDPLLGPLQDNGGPTFTHALLAGSPAIDAGSNPAALANDQRGPGFSRVSGAQADVGAFELQSADLSVTKVDTPDPVIAGANLTWTVTVSNAGPDAAATAAVVDTLPSGTTFVSLAAPGGWSCSTPAVGTNGTVSCSIASFPVGTAALTIVAAVDGATSVGTVLSNTATVTSVTPDPDSEDTSATATTTVASPALVSATKAVSGSFWPGGSVTYTIVLTNAGPGTQPDNPGNELVDVLPAELALLSAAATSGTAVATPGTNTVTWNGSIPAGGTVTITVVATVRWGTPRGAIVSNQATIAYDLDGDGTNEASGVSDDPATPAAGDATAFAAFGEPQVPVLGGLGVGILSLLVALGGALAARRRLP